MTDVTASPRTRGLHTLAVVLCSLLIAVPVFVGRLVEGILDTVNPAGVEVDQPLAYLREILGFGFGALGVLLVAILAVLVVLYRRGGGFAAIRLPLIVLAVQVALAAGTLVFSALAG